ncbi:hypothetical protein DL765_002330 [Monosporascus sp. GIB2]|nr:hypothetical protein DL765_002330 [Monosporascus sp. GIB2]
MFSTWSGISLTAAIAAVSAARMVPSTVDNTVANNFTSVGKENWIPEETFRVDEWAPGYAGFTTVWQDAFVGSERQPPDSNNWNIILGKLGVNGEWQTYRGGWENLQLSGGNTLQIVPVIANGEWTSGRVESKYTFTPQDGRVTRAEARLRFGNAPSGNKQGIWPAFWIMGDSIRHGVKWPANGEIDVMERVNGEWAGHGTIHCDVYPGGICNEPTGKGAAVGLPDNGWHVWRVEWDRRTDNWADEVLTWYLDGNRFHSIAGWQVGWDVWQNLAAKPLYFIMNVAVGGGWPGAPNQDTWDWYGNMMEIAYVAHFVSN